MTALPDYAVLGESDMVATLVAEPHWLYVWQTTDGQGESWLSVYRSVIIEDDDAWLDPFLATIAAGALRSEVVRDERMMRGRAELAIYAVSA